MTTTIEVLVVEDSDLHQGYIQTTTLELGSPPIKYTFWGRGKDEPFDVGRVREHILSNQSRFHFIVLDLTWTSTEETAFRSLNSRSPRGVPIQEIETIAERDDSSLPSGIRLIRSLSGNEIPIIIFTWSKFPGWDRFATQICGANYVLHKDQNEFKYLARQIRGTHEFRERQKNAPLHDLKGNSASMRQLRLRITEALRMNRGTVFLNGPSGSGKTRIAKVIARGLVGSSPEKFRAASAGNLDSNVIEALLFGREANFPIPPSPESPGLFGAAAGGVLFLDEIDKFNWKCQEALLGATDPDEPHYMRLGSQEKRPVNCRLIVASARDLSKLVTEGKFLAELYHRLNTMQINVPGLNDHREDIPALVESFLEEAMDAHTCFGMTVTEDAMKLLCEADWSENNCRQLKKAIGDAVRVTVPLTWIEAQAVRQCLQSGNSDAEDRLYWRLPESGTNLLQARHEFEKQLVEQALQRFPNLRTKEERQEAAATLLQATYHELGTIVRRSKIDV